MYAIKISDRDIHASEQKISYFPNLVSHTSTVGSYTLQLVQNKREETYEFVIVGLGCATTMHAVHMHKY